MNWKKRAQRRKIKRAFEQSNPEAVISSIQKKIEREGLRRKTFFEKLRAFFTKSHDEKVLDYAKQVYQK